MDDWTDRVGMLLGRASLSKASAHAHNHLQHVRDQLERDPAAEPPPPQVLATRLRVHARGKGNARFNRAIAAALDELDAAAVLAISDSRLSPAGGVGTQMRDARRHAE